MKKEKDFVILLFRFSVFERSIDTFYVSDGISFSDLRFENDVEMYGAQTTSVLPNYLLQFENDVEMYDAQTYFSNGVFTIGYRDWAPEHEKMGKGVTLTEDEMMKLKELL